MEGILSCLVLRAPAPDREIKILKFGSCSWLCSVPQTTMVPGAPPCILCFFCVVELLQHH